MMNKKFISLLLIAAMFMSLIGTPGLAAKKVFAGENPGAMALSKASDFEIWDGVLRDYNGTDTEVTIPDEVTSIGSGAFSGCSSLKSITIPDGVTSIGWEAFSYCRSLEEIELPDSVTSIDGAFQHCEKLTSITIPDGVTSIGYYTFYGCRSLVSITIPDSVTSIGPLAFYGCESLTAVTIPDGVTSIGYYAFSRCRSFTSIIIPDSVTSIDYEAFSGCKNLTSITIPSGVTTIGRDAFDDCSRLGTIMIPTGLDVADAGLPDETAKISYSIADDEIQVAEVILGASGRPVVLPGQIGGRDVTYLSEQVKEQIRNGQVIFEHPHTMDDGTITKEATCTDTGTMTYQCTICGHEEAEDIDAEGHDWDKWEITKKPTGTAEGERQRECTVCAAVEKEPIPASGLVENPTKPDASAKPTKKEKRITAINAGLKGIQTGKKLKITWGKVTGADGYLVYAQDCDKRYGSTPVKTVKGNRTTKLTLKKLSGKKLDTKRNTKFYVVAYKVKNGKKVTLAKSLMVHVAGKDSEKNTNVKAIKVRKTSYSLKKGEAVKIQPKATLQDKKKRIFPKSHVKSFRYASSNKRVASVSADGRIHARGTGKCVVYVYAPNCCKKQIKVRVNEY